MQFVQTTNISKEKRNHWKELEIPAKQIVACDMVSYSKNGILFILTEK